MITRVIASILVFGLGLRGSVRGQAEPVRRPIATWAEGAATAGLLAAGFGLDQSVQAWSQRHRSPTSNVIAHIGNTFGDKFAVFPALAGAMLLTKAAGSDQSFDAFWDMTKSAAVAAASTEIIKVLVGRARPGEKPNDHTSFRPMVLADHSFPSGHTATAFALAAAAGAASSSKALQPIYFGAATLTAWSRVNNNKHWLSDVIGGAAVGILVGRFVTRDRRLDLGTPNPVNVGVSIPLSWRRHLPECLVP